ncbi:hypothetical protein [Burkholderia sp. ABCPW 111]|nr:hypothetical protein [Burkholderia sp. ABCPW 111]
MKDHAAGACDVKAIGDQHGVRCGVEVRFDIADRKAARKFTFEIISM